MAVPLGSEGVPNAAARCGCVCVADVGVHPGVSLKIVRMFKCVQVDGTFWLAADMRLQCYDQRWAGYAVYAVLCGVVYVVGLPLGVFIVLFRRRHKLFGDSADPFVATTRAKYGFLYEVYGRDGWWWEVEELVRKLILSAVVVLFESGSPLQVRQGKARQRPLTHAHTTTTTPAVAPARPSLQSKVHLLLLPFFLLLLRHPAR